MINVLSYGIAHVSIGFLQDFNDFFMISTRFLYYLCIVLCSCLCFYRISIGFLSDFYGISILFLYDFYGICVFSYVIAHVSKRFLFDLFMISI